MPERDVRPGLLIAAYAVAFAAVATLAQVRPAFGSGITPWHPTSGLTVALLVLVGARAVPVAAVAGVATALLVQDLAPAFATAATLATLAPFAALAWAVRSRIDLVDVDARSATLFASATAATSVVSAGALVLVSRVAGTLAPGAALPGFLRAAFADAGGILCVTPLALAVVRARTGGRAGVDGPALAATAVSVCASLALVWTLPDADRLRFSYVLFFPVIAAALLWDWRGGLAAVFVVYVGLVLGVRLGLHEPPFTDLQVLLVALAVTALVLGAVVAERRRALEALVARDRAFARATQVATAGELATSVAHELNQPLAAVVGYLEAAKLMARARTDGDPALVSTLDRALSEALRSGRVVGRLRDFYVEGAVHRETVDVAALCRGALESAEPRARANGVALTLHGDATALVPADPAQIDIVLRNLVGNALDAVSTAARGRRRIRIAVSGTDDAVRVAVEDAGEGVPRDLVEHVFEPRVTSKPTGMGLGLAISRTIALAHGGTLTFGTSVALGGARFELMLPRSRAAGIVPKESPA